MSELCKRIHDIVNSAHKYDFNSGFSGIPSNGIYVMFEKGEFAHGSSRIVRIGTHTGIDQLPSRINQHFTNENKNRSIFRKNIGRCLLSGHNYADKWEHDITSRKNKEKYLPLLDLVFEKQIEAQISQYIQENLSFSIIPVKEKEKRLQLESQLIGTISLCNDCKPSTNWLGAKSPLIKIKQSGLWQIQGLYGNALSISDVDFIEETIIT